MIHGRHASALVIGLLFYAVSCGKKAETQPSGGPLPPSTTSAPTTPAAPATAVTAAAAAPAGSPPPDGKYERVTVEGVTVPMIHVMNGGAVVLVDTDGKKPRTWEEQYKKKRDGLLVGQFDVHKTNVNKNDTFEDDPIDKEGLWVIDAKGNVTKR